MTSMKIVLIIFAFYILQIHGQYNKNLTCSVSRPDIVGNGVKFLRNIVEFLRSIGIFGVGVCNPTVLLIDSVFEVTLTWRPFGNCSYCCPIKDPTHYLGYYLINKQTPKPVYIRSLQNLEYLKINGFDKNLPTIIYIHGFLQVGNGFDSQRIAEAYLSRNEDYNIILVDWKDLGAGPWYTQAAANVEIVGKAIANVLGFYSKTKEINLSKVHIIGFSLGAHVAGIIGKHLKNKCAIGRITGLDPAFPLFHSKDLSWVLSKTDADFVDVIHTNGGTGGYPTSLGHVDFYVNGGALQPRCDSTNYLMTIFCSHIYAFEIYAESVKNSSAFPAVGCGNNREFVDETYMGFSTNPKTSGDFYVNTEYTIQFSNWNRK